MPRGDGVVEVCNRPVFCTYDRSEANSVCSTVLSRTNHRRRFQQLMGSGAMREVLPAGFEVQWSELRAVGFDDLPVPPQTFKSAMRVKSGAPLLKVELEIESKFRIGDEVQLKLIRESLGTAKTMLFFAAGKQVEAKVIGAGLRVSEDTYIVDHAAALSMAQLSFRVRREVHGDTITTCKLPPLTLAAAGTHARMEIEVREPDGADLDAVDAHQTALESLKRLVAGYIGENVSTLEARIRIHSERHDFLVVASDNMHKLAAISVDRVRCEDLKRDQAAEFFELEVEADESQNFGEKIRTSSGIGALLSEQWILTAEPESKVVRATRILQGRR